MAITEDEQAAIDRAAQYSPTVYVEGTNDYGLRGDGYLTNFPRGLNDLATVAGAVARLAADVITKAADVVTKWTIVVTKAGEAAASATTANDKATIATTKAGEAAASATTANDKATVATTKAGEAAASATTANDKATIATTKAGEAAASATTANDKATVATTKAGEAAASATTANDKATIATTKAGEAAASATAAALFDPALYLPKGGGVLTGALATIAGSLASPAIRIGESDTGFFRATTGELSMCARAIEVLRTSIAGTLTFKKAARSDIVALTDGATVTPDFNLGNYFSLTLGGNRTLANPANLVAGQGGSIIIRQDGTGSRTLSYGSYWKFPGGTVPTLSTTASRVDRLTYHVVSASEIHAVLGKDFR